MVEGELDARPMGIGKGPKPPSYNLQTAVDVDTGLIVHHEVTSEPNDTRQLYLMAKATKDTLGISNLTVVADAGYSSGTAAAACEADGITACVPTNRSLHSQGDGTLFGRSAFVYQPEADTKCRPPVPSNEYKFRSRRDDDGGGGGDDGGDDASNAVGQRGNSGDGGGDGDGGGNTARLVRRLASLTRRRARHPSSTHSVHPEPAPEDRDN
jgi:hypothetical protein